MEGKYIGSIVRSKCGRDRKRVFMIVEECHADGRVLVCDGVLHPLSKPKKKNPAHLAVLAAAEYGETSILLKDDAELFRLLCEFEAKHRDL